MEEMEKCSGCQSREHGVFRCVGSDVLEVITQEKFFVNYHKKDIIFKENQEVTGFYCIKNGMVRTYKTSGAGKEQTFQISGKGKWLGFRDLVAGENYNHTSICLEDTGVCFISKDTISKLIKTNPEFQIETMKYLAAEWKEMENHLLSMATKQIHNRLAELLITFLQVSGGDNEITLNVTREVMATCIGTKTETLIRSLADFKDRNWIQIDKNKIIVLNKKALVDLSEQLPV